MHGAADPSRYVGPEPEGAPTTWNMGYFMAHADEFTDAFARAWFKLTHRDLGPVARYKGPLVPGVTMIWQDPVPVVDHPLVDAQGVAAVKAKVLASGLTTARLVATAWASASSFRGSNKRGGANSTRIRRAPQKDWAINEPAEQAPALAALEAIRQDFNAKATGGQKVSLADLIVLAGKAAVGNAAQKAGVAVTVPFEPGRTDASQDQTDVESFAPPETRADGFRNYTQPGLEGAAARWLQDKANLLTLTAPEMTLLVGGLRVLGAHTGDSPHGVFTRRPPKACWTGSTCRDAGQRCARDARQSPLRSTSPADSKRAPNGPAPPSLPLIR